MSFLFTVDEGQNLGDGYSRIVQISDGQNLGDDYKRIVQIKEGQHLGDGYKRIVQIKEGQHLGDTVQSRVKHVFKRAMTTKIRSHKILQRAMTLCIMESFALPEQDINNPDNIFTPIIYRDGVKLSGGDSLAGAYNALEINWGAIFPAAACQDILSWNINWDNSGGKFDIKLKGDYELTLGPTNVCGMNATITYVGPESSDSGEGTIVSGTFGSRALNKQLLLTAQSIQGVATPDQFLASPPSAQWGTCSAAALAIASFAGISLQWAAPDMTLVDSYPESGGTVGQALESLAQRCGGLLAWRGNDRYMVITPDIPLGGFTIPHCSLYTPAGARSGKNLDVTGPILLLPVESGFNPNVVDLPSALVKPLGPPVEPLHSTRAKLKSTDAPELIPKPGDVANGILSPGVDDLRIRVMLNANDPSSGTYFTRDPGTWFGVSMPIIFDPITRTYSYQLDSSQFDSGFKDGQHNMQVGYVRKSDGLNAAFKTLQEEAVQKQKLMVQSQQEKLRYFEDQSATATVNFFGVLPMAQASVAIVKGGVNFFGLIKTVSFTSPGVINITCGHFVKVNLDTARSKLDWFLATGLV